MTDHIILVTGGSGFVGVHTILQLLQKGYRVRTTLRNIAKRDIVLNALQDGGIADLERLQFVQAELTSDHGWNEAMDEVDYVLHVASPFPAKQPKDEDELIIPAREGALRVLSAARDAGVKRVVMTSSFAAIGYSNDTQGHVFTEADWTDVAAPLLPYIKSKTVAEKAAWNFIETEGGNLELTVINPVGIFGPVIGDISSASLDSVVKDSMTGAVTQSPDFTFGVVDVRDVADIHIKAMLHPEAKGQRFLATADGVMSFYDVAELIKKERPKFAARINTMAPTPDRFYINLSNEKAKQVLNWQPRSKEEAVLASADSIAKMLF